MFIEHLLSCAVRVLRIQHRPVLMQLTFVCVCVCVLCRTVYVCNSNNSSYLLRAPVFEVLC